MAGMGTKRAQSRRGGRAGAATAVGLMILGPSALAIDASPALARLAPQTYEIAPGPIADALSRLADESGAHLIFDAAIARHVFTRGVHGKRTLEEALDELLTGTNLGYRVDPEGRAVTILLAQNGAAVSDASGAEALPPIDVGAERAGPSGPMTAMQREKAEEHAYARTRASAATKVDTPILDTPRSVVVIPQQVLDDNQVLNVAEAVKFVSGVQSVSQFYDQYQIRGFQSNGNTYRNGLKLYNIAGTEDVSFIDRVEIVKGPTAMLYGRVQPGGLVNFVTKKPQEEAAYSIQEQFGSWGLSRTTIDATGPLNDDKSLLYRVIGVYDHADDFVDFRHRDNGAVMGALAWIPTSQFEANVQVEYYNNDTTNKGFYGQSIPALAFGYAVPGIVGRPADLPRHWTQNVPDMYSHYPDRAERVLVHGDWTYKFSDYWSITNRFHYVHQSDDQEYMTANGLNLATGNLNRYLGFYNEVSRDTYSLNIDLNGQINTGVMKHNILLGFDYYDHHDLIHGDDAFSGNTKGAIPSFNIFVPVYGGVAWPIIDAEHFRAKGNILSRTKQQDFGYYFQDDINFQDKIHLLLGGRFDVAFDAQSEIYGQRDQACFPICDGHYNPPWKGNPTEHKFSPNAGLLFKITPEYSLYSSFSQSFANSNALSRSFDGVPFKPQQAWQYEIGGKASLYDGALTASLAAYELHRTNVLTADTAHTGFSIAAGEARSRGIEADISGQIAPNINLVGSYTYTDAQVIRDNATGTGAIFGKRLPNVPRHAGNIWAVYDTEPGLKEGWKFGAGFYANGYRQGNATNSYQLPGYVRFDLMGAYRIVLYNVPVEAQLNIINVGDAKYFQTSNGGQYSYYGEPRTFIGSVKVKF